MKIVLLVFLLNFAGHLVLAEDFQYSRSCLSTIIPQDGLAYINTPELREINQMTGIRIVELTKPAFDPIENVTFQPEPNNAEKINFTKKIAAFLKRLPVDFLLHNKEVCFVIAKRFAIAEAITLGSVVIIPTDASPMTISHEFLHAVDSLHLIESNPRAWNDLNRDGGCVYEDDPKARVLKRNFPDIDECFVSPYGGTLLGEDRAELFSAMMDNYNLLLKDIVSQTTIDYKVANLKNFLRLFSPHMDEAFWINSAQPHYSWPH